MSSKSQVNRLTKEAEDQQFESAHDHHKIKGSGNPGPLFLSESSLKWFKFS